MACLAVSFLFSGIEAGILSVNRVRLRHRVRTKEKAALVMEKLLVHPERILITVLAVTNLMQIIALAIGVTISSRWVGDWGYVLVLAVALPVWVLCVELIPKSLFRRFPYSALAALSQLLRCVNYVLQPLNSLGVLIVQLLFKSRGGSFRLFSGREDFRYLTFESERSGSITSEERAIIHAVLDFRVLTARDVMIPMEAAGAVRGDLPLPAARVLARSLGVDRLPVTGDNGQISGLLDLHELAVQDKWHGAVEIYQRRIVRTELNEPAYVVLRKLRAARLSMAAVRDGDGNCVGVVQWEDLVRLLLLPADA
ncbi:MAG: CNNM domain-containing protein [Verrucomicrobiota bacterium]